MTLEELKIIARLHGFTYPHTKDMRLAGWFIKCCNTSGIMIDDRALQLHLPAGSNDYSIVVAEYEGNAIIVEGWYDKKNLDEAMAEFAFLRGIPFKLFSPGRAPE